MRSRLSGLERRRPRTLFADRPSAGSRRASRGLPAADEVVRVGSRCHVRALEGTRDVSRERWRTCRRPFRFAATSSAARCTRRGQPDRRSPNCANACSALGLELTRRIHRLRAGLGRGDARARHRRAREHRPRAVRTRHRRSDGVRQAGCRQPGGRRDRVDGAGCRTRSSYKPGDAAALARSDRGAGPRCRPATAARRRRAIDRGTVLHSAPHGERTDTHLQSSHTCTDARSPPHEREHVRRRRDVPRDAGARVGCRAGDGLRVRRVLRGAIQRGARRRSAPLRTCWAVVRLSRPHTLVRARRALRGLLRRESFDVVVCHQPWAYVVFGSVVRTSRIPGRPLGAHGR